MMVEDIGYLEEGTISIVAEDSIGFDTPFMGRFGLSVLLALRSEASEKQILYDVNSSAVPVLHNMGILGKSPDDISTIFLSHCHYDHTDGLAGVLEAIERPIPVIIHPETFRPCFEINPDGIRHIGMADGREELAEKGAIFTPVKEPLKLMTGVITSGEIERVTSFEKLEDLYTLADGDVVQDHERDDSALILNLPQGLVIVTGCCHSGIVNTMMHARRITGVDKVHAVIGGLHLVDASEEKLQKSLEALEDAEWVVAGHCTGFDAMRRIAQVMGERFVRLHTGTIIDVHAHDDRLRVSTIPTLLRDTHRSC